MAYAMDELGSQERQPHGNNFIRSTARFCILEFDCNLHLFFTFFGGTAYC